MSNHHARPRPSKKRSSKIGWVIFVMFLILVPFYPSLARIWSARYERVWPSVSAHLLEARIVVVGTRDRVYGGGEIDYRVEAHVMYEQDGVPHDAWLPASKIVADKTYLSYWLWQKKSKLVTVHWNPDNPSDIEAVLY